MQKRSPPGAKAAPHVLQVVGVVVSGKGVINKFATVGETLVEGRNLAKGCVEGRR